MSQKNDPQPMTAALYAALKAHTDGVDAVASAMERKWGVGRLRLLVDAELRERFDRQAAKWNAAIWSNDLERVRAQAGGMTRAWQALDAAAEASGAEPLKPTVWEARMPGGRVFAFVRTLPEAHAVQRDNRAMEVWTVEEVARVLAALDPSKMIGVVKQEFPGARVERVRALPEGMDLDYDLGVMDDGE
jgi:hypothetical protein